MKRINSLLKVIKRDLLKGMGDPEPLRHNWSGYRSRRIDREHRIIYKVIDGKLIVEQCRYHY
ncbi:MAG: Txe/YoeB family addiction module toxin [bacterium]|nr:Txe/YoeB family addiction module toxin [bacterium]